MKKRESWLIAAGSIVLWLAVPCAADDEPVFHEEIIVTATASERSAHDVPYTVEVFSATELRQRRLARTLPEALAEVPGVMLQKTAHGQGSPYVRGFTGFRNLFLIDGVRLNNSVFRDGPNQYWATVDPLGLERLEVVKGPVSSLYGSDAVGGTVNAITLAPPGAPTVRSSPLRGTAPRSATRSAVRSTRIASWAT